MINQDENNLSPEEQREFNALPRHRVPPQSLEEKIMNELKNRELITPPASSGWGWITKIAAAIVLVLLGGTGGYFAGKTEATPTPAPKNPLYVLLLHEAPGGVGNESELVAEYGQWAQGVYKTGRHITGEKLRSSGRILQRSNGTLDVSEGSVMKGMAMLGGYFIIEAADYTEAVRIASECPHLKYGGTIELREIEPT